MSTMSTVARGALGIAALAVLAGCATAGRGPEAYPPQRVELRLEPDLWQLARRTEQPGTSVDEYVPRVESLERWTRFVSVQTFLDAEVPFPGARWAMAMCRAQLLDRCPGATWTVVREGDRDALYEWKVAGCAAVPDQHEVGRVVNGRGTWARITFSEKGELDAATREEWLRRLSEARLRADPMPR